MIKLNEIKELKLRITWRLLYLGFSHGYFNSKDIINYAVERLVEGEDAIKVCELAGAQDYEKDYISDLLENLIESENAQENVESRKLRAIIVNKALKNKNANYIDGLMELTELWISLGFPEDSPHTIQGRGNEIIPQEYYTEKNYSMLYQKNKTWLNDEISYLIGK